MVPADNPVAAAYVINDLISGESDPGTPVTCPTLPPVVPCPTPAPTTACPKTTTTACPRAESCPACPSPAPTTTVPVPTCPPCIQSTAEPAVKSPAGVAKQNTALVVALVLAILVAVVAIIAYIRVRPRSYKYSVYNNPPTLTDTTYNDFSVQDGEEDDII